jgi:hypothetical protein
MHGHSSVVARIAGDAGATLGLDDTAVQRVHRASLVHDLGRVGVSNWIWDRRGPLSTDDWQRVRLHPYYTERILARCSLWPELALASAQHERLHGSRARRAHQRSWIRRSRGSSRRYSPEPSRSPDSPEPSSSSIGRPVRG